jgi:hypothetical protein
VAGVDVLASPDRVRTWLATRAFRGYQRSIWAAASGGVAVMAPLLPPG